MAAKVEKEKCSACAACVDACPTQAITVPDEFAVVDTDLCGDCGACVDACPSQAITIE